MPRTGEKCTQQGTYTGKCDQYTTHSQSAFFTVGDIFTPCATCGGQSNRPGGAVMNWTWVRSSK